MSEYSIQMIVIGVMFLGFVWALAWVVKSN